MNTINLKHKLGYPIKILLTLLGFCIPVSTSATSIILLLVLVCWAADTAASRGQNFFLTLKGNKVAAMGALIFLMYILATTYSTGPLEDISDQLKDGVKFLFIPMMMYYFKDDRLRSPFIYAFLSAMGLTLILSYLLWIDLLPSFIEAKGNSTGPDCAIFHDHIKQNIFMAFTVFVTAVLARDSENVKMKVFWGCFSALGFFNIFFLVAGRSGHLIMIVLGTYYCISKMRLKSVAILTALFVLIGATAWIIPANPLAQRAQLAIEEAKLFNYDSPELNTGASVKLRLEWYLTTLKLIKENPIIGTGTGSFKTQYTKFIEGTDLNPTGNPHNEYLMFSVQFGLIGLFIFWFFFAAQWQQARHSPSLSRSHIARALVLTLTCAALFSSPIQDNAEGWFFALFSAFLFSAPLTPRKQKTDNYNKKFASTAT